MFESQNTSMATPSMYSMMMIGAAVRQRAAIHQMRDIRMIELRQNLPLDLKARMHCHRERAAMHHFDGDLLLKLGIGALGQVNLAHPARTQGAQHPVRSYAISDHFREHAPRPSANRKHQPPLRRQAA